jgi:hypothetical protein
LLWQIIGLLLMGGTLPEGLDYGRLDHSPAGGRGYSMRLMGAILVSWSSGTMIAQYRSCAIGRLTL